MYAGANMGHPSRGQGLRLEPTTPCDGALRVPDMYGLLYSVFASIAMAATCIACASSGRVLFAPELVCSAAAL